MLKQGLLPPLPPSEHNVDVEEEASKVVRPTPPCDDGLTPTPESPMSSPAPSDRGQTSSHHHAIGSHSTPSSPNHPQASRIVRQSRMDRRGMRDMTIATKRRSLLRSQSPSKSRASIRFLTAIPLVTASLLLLLWLFLRSDSPSDSSASSLESTFSTTPAIPLSVSHADSSLSSSQCPPCPSNKCPPLAPCPAPFCPPCSNSNNNCPVCPPAPVCPNSNSMAIKNTNNGMSLPLAMCRDIPLPEMTRDDVSLRSDFQLSSHDVEWEYCYPSPDVSHSHRQRHTPDNIEICPEHAKSEWWWQLSWYERTDSKNKTGAKIPRDVTMKTPACAQLPPPGYTFPSKYPPLPADLHQDDATRSMNARTHKVDENYKQLNHSGYVNWPNLRVNEITDLLTFNQGTPKNLYHFDAIFYDNEQLHLLQEAARTIPFLSKVRLMLDIGAGGGSLGLLVKRLYDVTAVSAIFPDWPYCEYISERGGICMLIDAMQALPFAKYTYDVVHASWIYHGSYPKDLWPLFQEHVRVLRPGGYLWWFGGWSRDQVAAIESYAKALGLVALYDDKKPVVASWMFGTNQDIPYQLDWTVIYVKPIRAKLRDDCKFRENLNNEKDTKKTKKGK